MKHNNIKIIRNKLLDASKSIKEKIDIYATSVAYDIYNYDKLISNLKNLTCEVDSLRNTYHLLALDKSKPEETVKAAIQSYLTCRTAFETMQKQSELISNKIAKEKVNLKKMIMSQAIISCKLAVFNTTSSLDRSAKFRNIDVNVTLRDIEEIVNDVQLKTRAANEINEVLDSSGVVKNYTDEVNALYNSVRGNK